MEITREVIDSNLRSTDESEIRRKQSQWPSRSLETCLMSKKWNSLRIKKQRSMKRMRWTMWVRTRVLEWTCLQLEQPESWSTDSKSIEKLLIRSRTSLFRVKKRCQQSTWSSSKQRRKCILIKKFTKFQQKELLSRTTLTRKTQRERHTQRDLSPKRYKKVLQSTRTWALLT